MKIRKVSILALSFIFVTQVEASLIPLKTGGLALYRSLPVIATSAMSSRVNRTSRASKTNVLTQKLRQMEQELEKLKQNNQQNAVQPQQNAVQPQQNVVQPQQNAVQPVEKGGFFSRIVPFVGLTFHVPLSNPFSSSNSSHSTTSSSKSDDSSHSSTPDHRSKSDDSSHSSTPDSDEEDMSDWK